MTDEHDRRVNELFFRATKLSAKEQIDLLADHLTRYVPDNPTALVFSSPEGAPLRNGNFRRRIWRLVRWPTMFSSR